MKSVWWLLGAAALSLLGSDVLGRQMGVGALGAGRGAGVALTFDDGPSSSTPELLALLARHGARATFFLTGERAQADPAAVQAMRAAGHQLESHGYTHRHALTLLPWAEWRHVRWHPEPQREDRSYRPPWGGHSPLTRLLTRAAGVRVALWDVESHDWTDRDPADLARQMLAQLRPGSVLLLHDGPATTLALLEHLLPALKERGLEAVTLKDVQPQRIGWAAGLERLKRMW
ncbi:polysaccharide deacetylase [Deinococcus ruber]|uniref:Polysaccharide deacetylase n=1 Tax=Deinococcus ruber TaxID=1848197 RepID=A0A918CKK6_9DEIO|nr:polysaccharide deacetylase [Deinococcus ruber]